MGGHKQHSDKVGSCSSPSAHSVEEDPQATFLATIISSKYHTRYIRCPVSFLFWCWPEVLLWFHTFTEYRAFKVQCIDIAPYQTPKDTAASRG